MLIKIIIATLLFPVALFSLVIATISTLTADNGFKITCAIVGGLGVYGYLELIQWMFNVHFLF